VPEGQALYHLGVALAQEKKNEQAEKALLLSIKLLQNNTNAQEELQESLGAIVSVYKKEKQFDKAKKYAAEHIAVINAFYGAQSPEAGLAILQLAEVLKSNGEFEQAEAKGEEAAAIMSKNADHDDARLGLVKTMLASFYIADKKYAQARAPLAEALKIWETQRRANPACADFAAGLYERLRKEDANAGGT
jgi:tetratricopeptide (TPR) repeat protein